MKMKKVLLGVALSLAFGAVSSAHAASPIFFDQTGSGGAGVSVNTFDWSPDNGLVIGSLSTPPDGSGAVNVQVVAEAKLGNFIAPGNVAIPVASGEFTFVASAFERAVGIGTGTVSTTAGVGASSFSIWFNPVAGTANQITGAGYGTGTKILQGTLVSLNGNFTDNTILDPITNAPELLDQNGADNQNGTLTHLGNGSTTIRIDVSFADPNYFRSNITSLLIDLQDTSNAAVPFITADPSNQIAGVTPFYSLVSDGAGGFVRVNAAACTLGGQTEGGVNGARCDTHLQTDASTSFNPTVPEPGSLALLGGTLAAISLIRRRKTARTA